MKFGAVPTVEAEGALLGHGQSIGARRLPKGHVLGTGDLATATAEGIASLIVAQLEPGDVAEDEAATRLAEALAGDGVILSAARHGRVDLIATCDGLFACESAAVDAVNGWSEAIGLGTLWPLRPVRAGAVVATVKIIPYAVPGDVLAGAVEEARAAQIRVHAFAALAVGLIQTRLPGQPDKLFAATAATTRARLGRIGANLVHDVACAHDVGPLALSIEAQADVPVVLVAGASATVDRRDVIPSAIVAAGGTIDRLGMPVDPGNLLCLGRIGARFVIGLPGCARSPKRNGIDLVLERIAAGLPIDGGVIAKMGVGGLLADTADRPEPRDGRASAR